MDDALLRKRIPDSVLPYPKGTYKRSKYFAWKIISPFHNAGRDFALSVGLMKHSGRQDFVIGTIAPGRTFGEFVEFLVETGWCNHFIAWLDDDQVLSVRKPVGFEWQYHLRVFSDGEVRGHFEYTPECHPWWHLKSVRQEQRREMFLGFLGDWVVPVQE